MNLIDALFEVVNFGVFIAFFVYVLKRYIVPRLRENMIKEYHDHENLHDELQELTNEQNHLEESIVAQEDYAKVLFKKINHWRNSVDLQNEHMQEQRKQLIEQTQERTRHQEQWYQLHNMYDKVAPLVVEKLTKELSEKYRDLDKGRSYIDSLLADVRKS